jgi:hypothetical protein
MKFSQHWIIINNAAEDDGLSKLAPIAVPGNGLS